MKKKVFSILLICAMLLSAVPFAFSVSADEPALYVGYGCSGDGLSDENPASGAQNNSKNDFDDALAMIPDGGIIYVATGKKLAIQNTEYEFPAAKNGYTITAVAYDPNSTGNAANAFKMTAGADKSDIVTLPEGASLTFDHVTWVNEGNGESKMIVKSGAVLTVTDDVQFLLYNAMWHVNLVVEKGGKAILSKAAMENLLIEGDGEIVPYGSAPAASGVELKMTVNSKTAYVNGEAKTLDAEPIIRFDRTMLPVRFVAENLGATVAWDGATSTATLTAKDVTIEITIGAKTAKVNGEAVELDSPAFIENSRTYLPVRFVAEKLGATVAWDGATSTATITK